MSEDAVTRSYIVLTAFAEWRHQDGAWFFWLTSNSVRLIVDDTSRSLDEPFPIQSGHGRQPSSARYEGIYYGGTDALDVIPAENI